MTIPPTREKMAPICATVRQCIQVAKIMPTPMDPICPKVDANYFAHALVISSGVLFSFLI